MKWSDVLTQYSKDVFIEARRKKEGYPSYVVFKRAEDAEPMVQICQNDNPLQELRHLAFNSGQQEPEDFEILRKEPLENLALKPSGSLSHTDLTKRGWREDDIERLLEKPDRITSSIYKRGQKIREYYLWRVLDLENSGQVTLKKGLSEEQKQVRQATKGAKAQAKKTEAFLEVLKTYILSGKAVSVTHSGAIQGDTYDIKDTIKGAGGKWNVDNRVWMLPEHLLEPTKSLLEELKEELEKTRQHRNEERKKEAEKKEAERQQAAIRREAERRRAADEKHEREIEERKKYFHIESRGSGNGGRERKDGEVFSVKKEEGTFTVTVVKTSKKYYSEDGLTFGVGDDSGWIYTAFCREATVEEKEALDMKIGQIEAERSAKKKLDSLTREGRLLTVEEAQTCLTGLKQVRVRDDMLFLGDEKAFYGRYNGLDGDDWSYSNWGTYIVQELVTKPKELHELLFVAKLVTEQWDTAMLLARVEDSRYSDEG